MKNEYPVYYKVFRRVDDKTLMSLHAPTKYRIGRTKILKYPAFVEKDFYRAMYLFSDSGTSLWAVIVELEERIPDLILSDLDLTWKKIHDFWNGKIPGTFATPCIYGYRSIRPVEEVKRF